MKLLGLVLSSAVAFAQTPAALMNGNAVNQLCQRATQLMESGGVAVPDLKRAAGPVTENVKQACELLRIRAGVGQPTYNLMTNLRAYLDLSDAVPKPFPFPEAARTQLSELRDASVRLDAHFRALLDQKDTQLRSPDRDNLIRYSEANTKLAPPATGKGRVVFFGDSITDLWRLNEYFPDRDFVNRGISGQITSEMLGRMKADVLDLHPQAVLILAGTNDLARNVPLKTIQDNYAMMAELSTARGIKVIFASVLPVNDYHKAENPARDHVAARPPVYIRSLNDWLKTFSAQNGHTFVNYFDPTADPEGKLTNDISDDGLHPNSQGYRIMAPLALAAVDKVLAPAHAPSQAIDTKPKKRK
jgi:lysophospholipase L1-like esterase